MGDALKIVIDHLCGSRRGQRQEFDDPERLQFGRHPGCEVTFDTHRDLDASSRHAEIRCTDEGVLLRDIGSSNGTLIEGERVDQVALTAEESVVVEFGPGGPSVRIWIGDGEPPPVESGGRSRLAWMWLAIGLAAVLAIGLFLLLS